MRGISILICCYNSADKIELTLRHLLAQNVEQSIDWEVILINNNSTDKTAQIAHETWKGSSIPFKIIDEPRAGLSHARLAGVNAARYELISFVDDDNLVPNNWISYQNQVFENKEVGVLGCTSIGHFDFTPPEWYKKTIHQLAFATGAIHEEGFKDITEDALVYGAGMTLRKEIYQALFDKNWHPLLTGRIGNKQAGGEDSEFTLAARLLGYKVFYSNEIKTRHNISKDRLSWERLQKVTSGFGSADVFLTAYIYFYHLQKSKLGLGQKLRKFWWFNYFGKKLSLFIWSMKKWIGKISEEDFTILAIRINSYCETIKNERSKFKESFTFVKRLTQ
ncbi:glycosyltransferase [Jiulongibacter sp. NS-SX5]|uniref:glycosyltransferase n=1 Tax=Jiulongibacter sp. NS-SX5 TaxID=3463854 RepID=UPI004058745C